MSSQRKVSDLSSWDLEILQRETDRWLVLRRDMDHREELVVALLLLGLLAEQVLEEQTL